MTATQYSSEISEIEKLRNHKRTILLGDFNMNPFDSGMLMPNGFNATSSTEIAQRKIRKIGVCNYYYFYNPMWSLLGDRIYLSEKNKVPGSYYYDKPNADGVHWNLFDSIIVRPDLIESIDYSTLRIEEVTPQKDFKRNNQFPDHYPLLFTLNCTAQ